MSTGALTYAFRAFLSPDTLNQSETAGANVVY